MVTQNPLVAAACGYSAVGMRTPVLYSGKKADSHSAQSIAVNLSNVCCNYSACARRAPGAPGDAAASHGLAVHERLSSYRMFHLADQTCAL